MPAEIVRRRLAIVALVVTVLLNLPAVAAQPVASGAKGFIWRLEKGGQIGWLVGSLHVLTPDYYPLPDSMSKAFLRAVTLLEETDLRDMNSPAVAQTVVSRAMYPEGQSLKMNVSADTYRLTIERFTRLGLPSAAIDRMKPWMLAVTLVGAELQRAGFDPGLGVDRHFFSQAQRLGKKLRSLETVAEQLDLFATLPPKLQEALLLETVTSLDTEMGQVKEIAQAWKAGDASTVEAILLKPMMREPTLYQSLIVDRNRNWIPKIDACIQDGHCFIVVGAAHLVGPDGLITALQEKGYKVQQE